MKCSVFIASSLDGFIARSDGDVGWLDDPDYVIEGEDFGYNTFMQPIDAIIMGRGTFEKVLSFGKWPYEKPVIVLSSRKNLIPDHLMKRVRLLGGHPSQVLELLSREGFNNLYIDGGNTIQRFLQAGLINDITITTIPVLLGSGISLFGELEEDLQLHLLSNKEFPNGFIQTMYQPIYTNQNESRTN